MNIKFKKSVTLDELETLVKALKIKPRYDQNSCGCGEGWNDERCDELSKNTNCSDCIFSYIELINKPVETTNECPKLDKEDIKTIQYAEECLNEELSLGNYYKDFRPRWEKLLNKLRIVV